MSKKSDIFKGVQFVTSSISIMFVLLLLGIVAFFVLAANNLSVYVRENIAFSIELDDGMKESEILRFQKQLNAAPYIRHTTYISKANALKEQTEAMGTDPTEFLGYNPFPASIEVRLDAAYANVDSVAWIKKEIMRHKQVVEVSYPQDLLDSVNRNIRKLSLLLLGVAALLTLVSFVLINNTIRLTIYSQRFLIHTMKLVGASWSFIRRPFIIRNMWVGVLAGVLADTVLISMAGMLVHYEPELVAVVTPQVMLMVLAVVFLFGILITSFCAWISINKYLSMKVSNLYK